MIELPEAMTLARQLNETMRSKTIKRVIAAHSPHKWAWYYKDPEDYPERLEGKTMGDSRAFGSFVEVDAAPAALLFSEGVRLRYFVHPGKAPQKHQLLLEFEDASILAASIQMYGGLYCYKGSEFDNEYIRAAKTKPSPLSEDFDREYFDRLLSADREKNPSAKAFLATEQRIPGLGNGVLQDILFNARIHPKRKLDTFDGGQAAALLKATKDTLAEMAAGGGRDTEKDLFGENGGYKTILSRNTLGLPCPVCKTPIQKTAYLGGAVYFCPDCQKA